MKLVLQYKNKGDKPSVIHSSNVNSDAIQAFNESKEGGFLTEIWTLGVRQKAYYGSGKAPLAKKAVKKAKPEVSED